MVASTFGEHVTQVRALLARPRKDDGTLGKLRRSLDEAQAFADAYAQSSDALPFVVERQRNVLAELETQAAAAGAPPRTPEPPPRSPERTAKTSTDTRAAAKNARRVRSR